MELKQKFTIKLESYDSKLLEDSVKKIIGILSGTKSVIVGPVPLPTKKEITTVLRSPHVNKESREQFMYPLHRRLIEVYNNDTSATDALMKLDLNSAVSVRVKV